MSKLLIAKAHFTVVSAKARIKYINYRVEFPLGRNLQTVATQKLNVNSGHLKSV
jgi:hypothetical protein